MIDVVPPPFRPFEVIGRHTIDVVEALGRFGSFLGVAVALLFTPPFKLRAFVGRIHYIGFNSLLIILLTGTFTGMVLGLQIFFTLSRFGSEAYLGPAVALSIIRELGPVLSAFMVTGRTGSAMAAELGTMRATEQIDALYSMAINPIKYLVSPRIIASLIAMPLLTAIFDVVGIYGAYLVGVGLLGVSSGSYFSGMENSVVFNDVFSGFMKSLSFGLIITWVCCYKGFHAPPRATGVSQATTESVVLSFVLILVWDYFLTSVML
jgi:phospholipid/cholesterol/gamma-HCH transport system permease protein